MTWGSGRPWLRAWLRGVIARHLVAADPDDVARARASRVRMTHGGVRHARVVLPADTGRIGGAEFRRPNGTWEHGTEVRAHNAGEAAEILWLVDLNLRSMA